MTVELVLKTIGVLVIIKCLVLLLFPAAMIDLTRKIIKTKASLRKTAVIYLIIGIIIYILAASLL